MEFRDDDLRHFEANGAAPLPAPVSEGYVDHDGARIWYATYGSGSPVILLHGGLGHSGNWGYQLPALISAGHSVVLVDSRGHGRSTRDSRPFKYELMASDVLALMDTLHIGKAAVVGWSEHDEFIKPEHAEYLARSIPGAELILLPGVSHFAPLQRPAQFNSVVCAFLSRVLT